MEPLAMESDPRRRRRFLGSGHRTSARERRALCRNGPETVGHAGRRSSRPYATVDLVRACDAVLSWLSVSLFAGVKSGSLGAGRLMPRKKFRRAISLVTLSGQELPWRRKSGVTRPIRPARPGARQPHRKAMAFSKPTARGSRSLSRLIIQLEFRAAPHKA